jgi:putative tricarboxylic transport membrane protein
MMEQSLRQSLTISNGSMSIFFESTITIVLFVLTILSLVVPLIKKPKAKASK